MRPDGTGQRSLSNQFTDAFAPVWSPDGTRILFRAGDAGDFYAVDRDGSNLRKVLDLGEVALDFPGTQSFRLNAHASWLPDGKTIAICASSWPGASNIYLVEVASLKRTTLSLAKAAWSLAWSPDGMRIAFMTFNAAGQRNHQPFQVWLADGKGAQQVPISDECEVQSGPVWLPDGKRLVFVQHGAWSNGRQNNQLCMKNVEDGQLTETEFSWDVDDIVVSPDGQKIAFSPIHSDSPIFIFQLTGAVWRQEVTIENGGYPSWSPDGTSLAFVSSEDRQIWLVNADGTGRVKLNPIPERAAPVGPESSGGAAALDTDKERPKWSPTQVPKDISNRNAGDTAMPPRPREQPKQSFDGPRAEPLRLKAVAPSGLEKRLADASEEKGLRGASTQATAVVKSEDVNARYRASATPEENLARFPLPKLKTDAGYIPKSDEFGRVNMQQPPMVKEDKNVLSQNVLRDQYAIAPVGRYSTPFLMPSGRCRFNYDCGNNSIIIRVNRDNSRAIKVIQGKGTSLGNDVQQLEFLSLEDHPVQVKIAFTLLR